MLKIYVFLIKKINYNFNNEEIKMKTFEIVTLNFNTEYQMRITKSKNIKEFYNKTNPKLL